MCYFCLDPLNLFLIDAITGELRTAKPLDKEAIDNPEGILTFAIKVKDCIFFAGFFRLTSENILGKRSHRRHKR